MIDLETLSETLEAHRAVVRVVLAEVRGSAPREAGASMLVWAEGESGTIGGGRLEFDAVCAARAMLAEAAAPQVRKAALGPALNQCCGGAVAVVLEYWDAARYRALDCRYQGIYVRRVQGDAEMPGALARRCARHAEADDPLPITMQGGWLAESVWRNRRQVVIYGAGHVGRALARVLHPLPGFEVLVSDLRADELARLPAQINHTDILPTEVMASADPDAAHFIMTPEHDYDLELCHAALGRQCAFIGLIGSQTKWARFRSRLQALGHSPAQIARITCPIGAPELGKHPQAIAVSAASQLLMMHEAMTPLKKETA